MEEKTFMSLYQRPFAEQIAFNIAQLNYRYARLSEIDTTKGAKQYSVQNYYRAKGEDDKAQEIDDFLDGKIFSWSDKSIREVLKFIADKFVCHIDPIEWDDLAYANSCMSHLSNPYVDYNLKYIIDKIFEIMRK